jgi:hypothetical protein
MSTPFDTRPLPLTDADREAWAAYERANRRAAWDYAIYVAPTKKRDEVRPPNHPCAQCGKTTRSRVDKCRACLRDEKEA